MEGLVLLSLVEGLPELQYFVLDDKLAIHFVQVVHVSFEIVLQVLNEIDLEYHHLSYCVPVLHFALCLHHGQLFANL